MMNYGYMGGGGWFWMLIMAALLVVPFWRILPRHDIAAPVALVSIIPVGALVLLWVIAFKNDRTE